jgi:hypothetical protein
MYEISWKDSLRSVIYFIDLNRLIDWCLTPTLIAFQQYGGLSILTYHNVGIQTSTINKIIIIISFDLFILMFCFCIYLDNFLSILCNYLLSQKVGIPRRRNNGPISIHRNSFLHTSNQYSFYMSGYLIDIAYLFAFFYSQGFPIIGFVSA